MHIAVINSFPSVIFTAEMEYIHRFMHAAKRTGHCAYEVVTSDDIHNCQPDFVIATHEFSPKLTEYFTLGTMWGPYSYILNDARKLKSVLSYDAYLVGSSRVHGFLDALEFSTGVHKPRSDFLFLPTALEAEFERRRKNSPRSLAYVGVHWDGLRHNGLLLELHRLNAINIYGPPNSWTDYPKAYRGPLPFNGSAVAEAMGKHGIALCIHKDEHRIANTPSMRLFEAASAGCVIIVDEIPFAKQVLGNSVFHIDMRDPPELNAKKIADIVRWTKVNEDLANDMAARSHKILNEQFSIETLLNKTCDFVVAAKEEIQSKQKSAVQHFTAPLTLENPRRAPLVDIIVRSGSRDVTMLRRALRCIARQSMGNYRVLLMDYKGREDIRKCAIEEATSRLEIEYLPCEDSGLRSTSLWRGLRAVKAPFFAMLDDDDTIMSSHFSHLLSTAADHPDHVLYYSGSMLKEEEPGHYMSPVNFAGPLDIEFQERRELKFMDVFSLSRLCEFDNYILTNSWVARSSCLDERTLSDPQLEVVEDMYLYYMLARFGSFKLSPSPTAVWHFRSSSRDNSMLGVDSRIWEIETKKLSLRLWGETLYNGSTFGDMRHFVGLPAPRSPDPVVPLKSRPIDERVETYFSPETVTGTRKSNVHSAEPQGMWTSAPDSSIHLKLSRVTAKVAVRLKFMAAGSPKRGEQYVTITANGQTIFEGGADPWQLNVAEAELIFFEPTDAIAIRTRCSYVFTPSEEGAGADTRAMGIYLSSIEYSTCSFVGADAVPLEIDHTNEFMKDIRGIVHVGANTGQERELYAGLGLDVLWIEPIPEVFEELSRGIDSYPNQQAVQALVTDEDDAVREFNVANNGGASSSVFDFHEHKDIWPEVTYSDKLQLKTVTLPSLFARNDIDPSRYQALLLDTQGAELLVLKGTVPLLNSFTYIKTEVADFESYKGCCQLAEIESFMAEHGFDEVSRHKFAGQAEVGNYYDIVYKRV